VWSEADWDAEFEDFVRSSNQSLNTLTVEHYIRQGRRQAQDAAFVVGKPYPTRLIELMKLESTLMYVLIYSRLPLLINQFCLGLVATSICNITSMKRLYLS